MSVVEELWMLKDINDVRCIVMEGNHTTKCARRDMEPIIVSIFSLKMSLH